MSQNVVVGDTLVWGGVVFRQARQSLFGEGHLPQRQVSGYPGASALPMPSRACVRGGGRCQRQPRPREAGRRRMAEKPLLRTAVHGAGSFRGKGMGAGAWRLAAVYARLNGKDLAEQHWK